MPRTLKLSAVAVTAMACAMGVLTAAPATSSIRAGEMALWLARAAGVSLPDAGGERIAAKYLADRGVVFGDRIDATVRQRDLVEAARVLGIGVRATKPSEPITPAQGAAFVGAARGSVAFEVRIFGPAGTKEGDINASCRGRLARSGRTGTPASPSNPNATAPPCEGDEPEPEPQP
jgi:hypothetical protein